MTLYRTLLASAALVAAAVSAPAMAAQPFAYSVVSGYGQVDQSQPSGKAFAPTPAAAPAKGPTTAPFAYNVISGYGQVDQAQIEHDKMARKRVEASAARAVHAGGLPTGQE
ncbi:hypothetical protein GT347_22500 [Xylophilus rhododendri]|uniref:DUF4148 domain-containing protein n=1 Tax=Xylophilus rhododendri TaxID=2697032 RepID=A0A857JBG5_9BURK|nr:hypothetical protein [Xylophilus rhododendri]QHJ00502.1 hypothetical protein GT347_22500 [Xylophilus rhododendri]